MDQQELFTLSDAQLKAALECMLFVSPQPLVLKHVAKSLNLDELEVDRVMHELRLDYADRGLQIIRIAGGYQMCTRPEYAEFISALLKPERTRLSQAALETVAIVAYKQPITQPEIEAIRGVNSDGVLKTLIDRGLVKQAGRRETVGRPMLYTVTDEFLSYFGLNDLTQLPEIDAVATMVPTEPGTNNSEANENPSGNGATPETVMEAETAQGVEQEHE